MSSETPSILLLIKFYIKRATTLILNIRTNVGWEIEYLTDQKIFIKEETLSQNQYSHHNRIYSRVLLLYFRIMHPERFRVSIVKGVKTIGEFIILLHN